MKIGIISDSPLLTSGFGVEANQVATALANAGHNVTCFGLKGKSTDDPVKLPFQIWNIDVLTPWNNLLKDFILQEQPSKIIILIDLFNLSEIVSYLQEASWQGETIVFLTPDGLPAYDEYINKLRMVDKCIVTTETTKRYLASRGISVYGVAPPGVDRNVFTVLSSRSELRYGAGLSNCFVVGVFGRNCERKQQPRILQAIAQLADPNIVVYFHCSERGYWHLDEITQQLEITDRVIFSEIQNEVRGVSSYTTDFTAAKNPSYNTLLSYGYVQRLNCCDLIVNASHSGDVEHIILEAQSCGIPLAHTNDEGIMAEGVGDGGLLLRAADVGWGRIGERIYLIDPSAIVQAIHSIKNDPELRLELRNKGFENLKNYSWDRLRSMMVEIVRTIDH